MDYGSRHILHPHRLKACIRTGQGHDRQDRLQLGEEVHEAVARAKDHTGAQHGDIQARLAPHSLALCLGAQVMRGRRLGRLWHAQRADMDHAVDLLAATRLDQSPGQGDMGSLEITGAAMQDGDQVDDDIGPAQNVVQIGIAVL